MSIPIMFWSFVAYAFLQWQALKHFEGNLRKAAKLPGAIALVIVILTAALAFIGSNLFPVFLLLSGPILLVYMVALFCVYFTKVGWLGK